MLSLFAVSALLECVGLSMGCNGGRLVEVSGHRSMQNFSYLDTP